MFADLLSRLKHWLVPSGQAASFPPLNFFKMKTESIYCEVQLTGTTEFPYFQDPSPNGKVVKGEPKPNAPGFFFGMIENPAPGEYDSIVMYVGEPSATNTKTYLYQKARIIITQPLVVDFYLAQVREVDTPDAPAPTDSTSLTSPEPTVTPAATQAAYITAIPS